MKRNDFMNALNNIDFELVEKAAPGAIVSTRRAKRLWKPVAIAAVCVAVVVGTLGGMLMLKEDATEENRFINNEPRYGYGEGSDACIEPEYKISCHSMDEYLEAKSNSGFSVEEGWIPWEQFSVLGDFKKSYWIKGGSGSAEYEYLYTDPNTGKSMVYSVNFDKLPEKAAIVNMKEYEQWYYGKEISEDFFERSTVRYTSEDFSNPDLTKDQEVKKGVFILLDDILRCSQLDNGQLRSFISFVYNGYKILIVKQDANAEDYLPFNSSEDHEIIRRLTNTETYMDAIKELMDPKNAQTAK